MRHLLMCLVLLVGFASGEGCSEPSNSTCAAGATQQCWCLGSEPGVQICEDDGARWGECQCVGSDGDADIDSDADIDGDADSDGYDVRLLGAVEKGPFLVGSLVVVALIDGEGNPSGEVFNTHTINDLGEFELVVHIPHYASLEASGYFYNELTGELSDSPITLQAFYEAEEDGRQEAYINIFTHLAYGRVRTHLLTGADFRSAIRQAERALRRNLGVGPATFDPGETGIEMNILGGDTDANAYLLAVSSVLAQAALLEAGEDGSIDSALQELVNTLMGDLQDDGELSEEIQADLRAAEAALDPVVVMDLLRVRLEELGSDAEVPDIRRIIDRDDDGFLNADDCDDTDPEIHEGAAERCNGLDDDCDGVVPEDVDGDGYADAACGGDDCDDLDESRHPGVPDVCGDDFDADCREDADLPTLGVWTDDCVLAGVDDIARARGYSTISGSLVVTPSMPQLIGMECLESVEGGMVISRNEVISSLLGLAGLTSVGGNLDIDDNDALPTLAGLDGLERIGGQVEIDENNVLTSLEGLGGLRVIDGDLRIETNRNLRSLEALSGLTTVEGLLINDNDPLTNLNGLEGLSSVTTLSIADNDALEDLDGLSGVVTIDAWLDIRRNRSLADVDGLGSVVRVDGGLTIIDNDSLTNLDGLSALTEAGAFIVIQDNTSLPTCRAEALVDGLVGLGWDGLYEISGNRPECDL